MPKRITPDMIVVNPDIEPEVHHIRGYSSLSSVPVIFLRLIPGEELLDLASKELARKGIVKTPCRFELSLFPKESPDSTLTYWAEGDYLNRYGWQIGEAVWDEADRQCKELFKKGIDRIMEEMWY